MVTVRDLLMNNETMSSEMLAGNRGLDKEVKAISIIDAPSSIEWLRGNEIILTTAFLYQTDDKSLFNFVKSLIDKNVSALGIKVGRYIKSVPRDILDLADINAFPIFVLPYKIVWSEFIEMFYRKNNETEDYGHYLKFPLSTLITRMDNEGCDTVKRYQQFVNALVFSAVIVTQDYKIIAKNDNPLVEELISYCANVAGVPRIRVFRMQTTCVDDIWYYDTILSDDIHMVLASYESGISSSVIDRLRMLYHSTKNRMLLRDSFEFLLKSLVESIIFSNSRSDSYEIARQLGIKPGSKFMMLIIEGEDLERGRTVCKQALTAILGTKHFIFYSTEAGVQENRHMVGFIAMDAVSRQKAKLYLSFKKELAIRSAEEVNFKLYFSDISEHLDDLRRQYLQAQVTYQYCHVLGLCNNVLYYYRDVQPFEYLLRTDLDFGEIDMLAESITTFDAVQALEFYLEYNNVRQAAEANYVHENTMRYRINKVRAEISSDLDNPLTRLSMLLKIKLWRLNKTSKEYQRNF